MVRHKRSAKGYKVVKGRCSVTDRMGYLPVYSEGYAMYIAPGEKYWFRTKQEAIDETYKWE